MEISVHLKPEEAACFHRGELSSPKLRQLLETTKTLGLNLEPKHPGNAADPRLATQFSVSVRDAQRVPEIINSLKANEAVETAYRVPDVELP
jgi:hypothetical protein